MTPLRIGTETVGELAVGRPAEQLRLPPTTEAVLGLVAAPLAQALRAARLGDQLQASRGRVVAALEEERRRMRRDLHDGLGPTLTGIAYSADAARNLLPPGSNRPPPSCGRCGPMRPRPSPRSGASSTGCGRGRWTSWACWAR